MRLCPLFPAALLALAGCAAEPVDDQPPFSFEVPVDRSSLDNGLEVLVLPNHTAPAVTALVAVRAGSAVEDAATNGYSHLFEHMIFQGSEAVPDSQEFRDRLDNLGVVSNGTTSVDRVTYFFTASSGALEPALELFAGAIIAPALDPMLLEKEKDVVLGEFDLNESDSDFLHYRATLADLFGDYATALDPLGTRAAVEAATTEQLRAMHAAHYVPDNALLVLSGDVTPERGRELAARYFSPWPGPQRAGAGAAAQPDGPARRQPRPGDPRARDADQHRSVVARADARRRSARHAGGRAPVADQPPDRPLVPQPGHAGRGVLGRALAQRAAPHQLHPRLARRAPRQRTASARGLAARARAAGRAA
jgi:zinc protease